jgi:hypothetical protein
LDLEAVEMAARRQALHWAARALEQRLNTDLGDHLGAELTCSCGGSAKYHGRHGKTFESERHLRRLVKKYLRYYHEDRTHLALEKDTPAGRVVATWLPSNKIVSLPRLGGLHHRYAIAA